MPNNPASAGNSTDVGSENGEYMGRLRIIKPKTPERVMIIVAAANVRTYDLRLLLYRGFSVATMSKTTASNTQNMFWFMVS